MSKWETVHDGPGVLIETDGEVCFYAWEPDADENELEKAETILSTGGYLYLENQAYDETWKRYTAFVVKEDQK